LGRTSEAFSVIGGVFTGGKVSATPGTVHVKASTTKKNFMRHVNLPDLLICFLLCFVDFYLRK
jgi:hypothetical protein